MLLTLHHHIQHMYLIYYFELQNHHFLVYHFHQVTVMHRHHLPLYLEELMSLHYQNVFLMLD